MKTSGNEGGVTESQLLLEEVKNFGGETRRRARRRRRTQAWQGVHLQLAYVTKASDRRLLNQRGSVTEESNPSQRAWERLSERRAEADAPTRTYRPALAVHIFMPDVASCQTHRSLKWNGCKWVRAKVAAEEAENKGGGGRIQSREVKEEKERKVYVTAARFLIPRLEPAGEAVLRSSGGDTPPVQPRHSGTRG
ncbi:unnamed protein product [Pleuronectes platessa]|uniref:Uncharacterized protein n=1 Tax=Pleuronectes platessa TaxID=8262 RepID=A0A9N7VPG1_PLEPL|nr:unnamed protein product [Pleuronectes platessa]